MIVPEETSPIKDYTEGVWIKSAFSTAICVLFTLPRTELNSRKIESGSSSPQNWRTSKIDNLRASGPRCGPIQCFISNFFCFFFFIFIFLLLLLRGHQTKAA
jgi:hypothetical protein